MLDIVLDWIRQNYFELLAAGLGFIAIFLQIKQNVWYWLISIIMVSMYIYIYIGAKLYADMSLQVYYLVISFYGWYMWLFGNQKNSQNRELPVTESSVKLIAWSALISLLLFFIIRRMLTAFTDSDLPGWDAFTTALSFTATWMLARKKLENWLVWIVVDAVSAVIYVYKGLYATSVLFLFLTGLAWVGYRQWAKTMPRDSATN